jgi:hypothetical protein
MSNNSADLETRERIKRYQEEIDKRQAAIVKDKEANLRLRAFHTPAHTKVDLLHPTGNPQMFSPTGFVPMPSKQKWNQPKKTVPGLPQRGAH